MTYREFRNYLPLPPPHNQQKLWMAQGCETRFGNVFMVV